jgi:hypothetical protein
LVKREDAEKFGFFDKNRDFFYILSFYQVYESLPNNPQTHQQGIYSPLAFSDCSQTPKAMNTNLENRSSFLSNPIGNVVAYLRLKIIKNTPSSKVPPCIAQKQIKLIFSLKDRPKPQKYVTTNLHPQSITPQSL